MRNNPRCSQLRAQRTRLQRSVVEITCVAFFGITVVREGCEFETRRIEKRFKLAYLAQVFGCKIDPQTVPLRLVEAQHRHKCFLWEIDSTDALHALLTGLLLLQ